MSALRVRLLYTAADLRLIEAQPVRTRVAPSASLGQLGPVAGAWFEVQDTDGQAIYRHILHNPFEHWIETYDAGGRSQWHRVDDPDGELTLLVPTLPTASSLVLFASPPDRWPPSDPAVEVGRFEVFG